MTAQRNLTSAIIVAFFLLGTSLRIAKVGNVQSRSPDERIYTTQALAILRGGIAGARASVQTYLHNPELQFYPSPTRIGYASLIAATMRFTGITDERAGAYLACAASILSLALLIPLGLQFFGNGITALASLFLAVYPPELVIARRCWQDALIGLAGIVMLYLTLRISASPRTTLPYILLAGAGSAAVLIKETSVIMYSLCLFAVLWISISERQFIRAAVLFSTVGIGAFADLGLLASASGSVRGPFEILSHAARLHTLNSYTVQYASGPGYLLLVGFEALTPAITNLAIGGLAIVLIRRGRLKREPFLLALFVISLVIVFMLVPHWLNLRYLSPAYAPLCLIAGFAVWQLALLAKRLLPRPAFSLIAASGALLIVLALYGDYRRFDRAFVQHGANDLSVGAVFATLRD